MPSAMRQLGCGSSRSVVSGHEQPERERAEQVDHERPPRELAVRSVADPAVQGVPAHRARGAEDGDHAAR